MRAAATVGGQQKPVHWGGDCESTFNGMAQSLRAGLSLTSSGFGFWSRGHPAVSKVRSRTRPSTSVGWRSACSAPTRDCTVPPCSRVPWLFDEEDEKNGVALVPGQTAVDVVREFTKLKLENSCRMSARLACSLM